MKIRGMWDGAKLVSKGLAYIPDPDEVTARAIRRLTWWHRMWEINNPDKIVIASFASDHDLNHEHQWHYVPSPVSGRPGWSCYECPKITTIEPEGWR